MVAVAATGVALAATAAVEGSAPIATIGLQAAAPAAITHSHPIVSWPAHLRACKALIDAG
jgi:hypothetical protein